MNKSFRRLLASMLITGALAIGALSTLPVDGACHRNGLGGAPNPKLAKQIAETTGGCWKAKKHPDRKERTRSRNWPKSRFIYFD